MKVMSGLANPGLRISSFLDMRGDAIQTFRSPKQGQLHILCGTWNSRLIKGSERRVGTKWVAKVELGTMSPSKDVADGSS